MKNFLLTLLIAVAAAVPCRAQFHLTLNTGTTISESTITPSNANNIIDGLNANASPGKQFDPRLIPGGSGGSGAFVGTQQAGVRLSWGSVETFAGQTAAVSIQNFGPQNGLEVHTAGNGGIAIIGQSDTGAAAGKLVQTGLYDFPCLMLWRTGTTVSSDGPLMDLKSWGAADIVRVELVTGTQTVVDVNAAVHPPHLSDSLAQNGSTYFSTNQGKLCFKDDAGAVHPLY